MMADYAALERTVKSLVNMRLSAAAAEEILGIARRMTTEFQDQALHSKQEMDRQRRLLDKLLKPELRLHRTDFRPMIKSEQEWCSSLDQEELGPPRIKEEQEELLKPEDGDGATLTSVRQEDDAETPLDLTPPKLPETLPGTEGCGVSTSSDTEDSDEWDENMEPLESKASGMQKTSTSSRKGLGACVTCTVCAKGFEDYFSLVAHMRILHTGAKTPFMAREKTVHCTHCGNGFANMVMLNRHMTIHTGGRRFSCTDCGKTFRQKRDLTKHASIHTLTGEKSFGCTYCGKSFGKFDYLKRHIKSHTLGKPYSCPACDKCFRNNAHLKTHMRTHTGEKPYICTDCGKGFSQTSSLKTHMKIHAAKKIIT